MAHKKIEDLTDDELREDLQYNVKHRAALEAEQLRRVQAQRAAREALLREHVDALLAVVPEHSRTSCSDDNACNGYRWCTRCALLELKEYGSLPSEAELEITLTRARTTV